MSTGSDSTQAMDMPPPEPAGPDIRVRAAGASDVGLVRKNNEDSFQIRFLDTTTPAEPPEGEGGTTGRGVLLVVSDGMGGVEAGEIASSIAVEVTGRVLDEEWARRGERTEFTELRNDLRTAVARANRAVLDNAAENPSRTGMGATLTVAAILRDHLLVAHVGDSRCYLMRGGDLKCLTADQSLAEELVRRGIVKRGSPAYDQRRSVLIRVVGQAGRLEADAETAALARGDRVMLCSDGLHGPVDDETIARILGGADSPRDAVRDLVAAARENGAPDNVTCVAAFVEGGGLPSADSMDVGGATVSVAMNTATLDRPETTMPMQATGGDATGEYRPDEVLADPQLLAAVTAPSMPGGAAPPGDRDPESPDPDAAGEPVPASAPGSRSAPPPLPSNALHRPPVAPLPFVDPGPPAPGTIPGRAVLAGLSMLLAVLLLTRMLTR